MLRGVATAVCLFALATAGTAASRWESASGSDALPRSLRFVEKRNFAVEQVRTIGITFDGQSLWISSKGEGDEPPVFHRYDEWGTHLDTRERLQNDLLMHLAGAWSRFPRQTARPPL